MARTSAIGRRLSALEKRVFHRPLRRRSVLGFGVAALLAVTVIGALQFALATPPAIGPIAAADKTAVKRTENDAKTKEVESAGGTVERPADFASISYWIAQPLGWNTPEKIAIAADGSCVYTIEGRPARGTQKEWPSGRQSFALSAGKLRQLANLLQKTDWLAAPGGEGPAMPTDAAEVKLVLERNGQTRGIKCMGRRPEPYQSLLWFFAGLACQENRVYRLTWGLEYPAVCRELSGEIEALQGVCGRGLPLYDIDYSRYVPFFDRVLQRPYLATTEQVVTAIQLASFLGRKSQTRLLVKLANDRDDHVRTAVAKALADFGGPDVVPVLAENG